VYGGVNAGNSWKKPLTDDDEDKGRDMLLALETIKRRCKIYKAKTPVEKPLW
jgi:hypothetical protein